MVKVVGNRVLVNDKLETVEISIVSGKIVDVHAFRNVAINLPVLMPGFIDVHVHGGGGADTMDGSSEAFETIVRAHACHGTTSLLLTTMTEKQGKIEQVLDAVKMTMKSSVVGARVLGVHLEGPFIHPDKSGAQSEGFDADLVALDNTGNPIWTMVGGNVVFGQN